VSLSPIPVVNTKIASTMNNAVDPKKFLVEIWQKIFVSDSDFDTKKPVSGKGGG
jgi:hypothetical protein